MRYIHEAEESISSRPMSTRREGRKGVPQGRSLADRSAGYVNTTDIEEVRIR
jgi:hypothetical protein